MEPSPLTVVRDHCAFLGDYGAGCLVGNVFLWEPIQETTYAISNSRFVETVSGIATGYSQSVTVFGHCAVQ
jgi:hypothetical protein